MSFFVGKLILIAGFMYAYPQTECKQSHGFVIRPANVIRPAIDFFKRAGDNCCNAVRNRQGQSPMENMLALFLGIKESAGR
jgi:hypothetical protein